MKIKKIELFAIAILFLFSVYMWTLPIQKIKMPYGEVDSAHHLGYSDYMSTSDKIADIYPFYMYYRYGKTVPGCEGCSAYAPNFFINEAIAQIMGGDRIVSYYLFLGILDTAIVLTMFFFLRKLFGFWPAFLASFLLIFSKITILSHLMGQYVILISFATLPLILYCYYKHTDSFLKKEKKPVYLYIMSFLMFTQFVNHYQSLMDTAIILLVFTLLLFIKERKIPFDIKHFLIAMFILAVLIAPQIEKPIKSLALEVESSTSAVKAADISQNWGDVFRWYTSGYSAIAIGQGMFSYGAMHGLWTLPFLFLGIIFLLLRRGNKDLLLLSWLFGLYIVLHFDLFFGWGASRLLRSVNDVPNIFYALMAVGLLSIPAYIGGLLSSAKINFSALKPYLNFALIIIFITAFTFVSAKSSYEMLDKAYGFPYRINPYQYEAAEWMRQNIPYNSFTMDIGTLTQPTKRYIRTVAQRYIIEDQDGISYLEKEYKVNVTISYMLFDYSELTALGLQNDANKLAEVEKANFGNLTPVYNKNNIRVYKIA